MVITNGVPHGRYRIFGRLGKYLAVSLYNGGKWRRGISDHLSCLCAAYCPAVTGQRTGHRTARTRQPGGQHAQCSGRTGASPHWKALGGLAVVGIFVIMSYYTVIAGWTFDYFFLSITGKFNNISSAQSGDMFAALTGNPLRLLLWHSVVNILVVLILRRGVQAGIEKAVNFLIPALFLRLIIMVLYAISPGIWQKRLNFCLSRISAKLR